MRRVLHDCGTGAVIAKGMVGGAFAAVDHRAGLGESVSVVYPEGYTTHDAGVRVLAVRQIDVNTPETPDPGQRPAKFDAASGPQGPGAGGFEAFQDTLAKSSRGLRAETCDGSLEIRARAPPAVERE